jgi:hypothetical protein
VGRDCCVKLDSIDCLLLDGDVTSNSCRDWCGSLYCCRKYVNFQQEMAACLRRHGELDAGVCY